MIARLLSQPNRTGFPCKACSLSATRGRPSRISSPRCSKPASRRCLMSASFRYQGERASPRKPSLKRWRPPASRVSQSGERPLSGLPMGARAGMRLIPGLIERVARAAAESHERECAEQVRQHTADRAVQCLRERRESAESMALKLLTIMQKHGLELLAKVQPGAGDGLADLDEIGIDRTWPKNSTFAYGRLQTASQLTSNGDRWWDANRCCLFLSESPFFARQSLAIRPPRSI